jgi:hypothetical protein
VNALIQPKTTITSPARKRLIIAPDSINGLAMAAVALTLGLILLLAIVKVVLERSDYQARDQDDWI